ncbi:hypothetical protein H4219_004785 [Mycoemilia scoparia]|uniref:Frataxin n=1 Tax=Mycoemilia scoparia TaxID=417184 RepID=A0A9W7ZV75_9FUNG|nr:hypothetical protein H4219_004785 [Mycoemilia scoparia]
MIELDEMKHEKLSSQAFGSLTGYLKDLGDQMVDNKEFDIEYSQGVLALRTGNTGAGVYVLNKQPPNKQIWVSLPVSSGPERCMTMMSIMMLGSADIPTGPILGSVVER